MVSTATDIWGTWSSICLHRLKRNTEWGMVFPHCLKHCVQHIRSYVECCSPFWARHWKRDLDRLENVIRLVKGPKIIPANVAEAEGSRRGWPEGEETELLFHVKRPWTVMRVSRKAKGRRILQSIQAKFSNSLVWLDLCRDGSFRKGKSLPVAAGVRAQKGQWWDGVERVQAMDGPLD